LCSFSGAPNANQRRLQLTRVDFVERLTSLRELSLNANQLVTLPRLPPRLESLQAAENQLTSVDELTLRDAVSALRTLALPKNKLRALPWATLAHATALERLVLHRNELGALDECVARLTRLQLLDVRENAPLLRLPHAVAEMRRNARALVELPPSMQQQLSFQLATSLPDLVLFDELDALVARSRSLSRRLMIGDAVCAANLPCLVRVVPLGFFFKKKNKSRSPPLIAADRRRSPLIVVDWSTGRTWLASFLVAQQANGVSHVLNAAADLRPVALSVSLSGARARARRRSDARAAGSHRRVFAIQALSHARRRVRGPAALRAAGV
jgi:hypothetical protein